MRLRKVHELAPNLALDGNPACRAHVDATQDVAEASLDGLVWAGAIILGSPTRYGNMAAHW